MTNQKPMRGFVEDGVLSLDLRELFYSLTEEGKRDVAQTIALDAELLALLCSYVVKGEPTFSDGTTGYAGFCTGPKSTLIENARVALLPLMSEMVRHFVEKLVEERNRGWAAADRWREECWKLERIWRDSPRPPERGILALTAGPDQGVLREDVAKFLEKLDLEMANRRDVDQKPNYKPGDRVTVVGRGLTPAIVYEGETAYGTHMVHLNDSRGWIVAVRFHSSPTFEWCRAVDVRLAAKEKKQ